MKRKRSLIDRLGWLIQLQINNRLIRLVSPRLHWWLWNRVFCPWLNRRANKNYFGDQLLTDEERRFIIEGLRTRDVQ